jgi:nucleotide-binding universal stress UspA family protein
MTDTHQGPGSEGVVFAYDGSDLARAAIDEAGHQLAAGRDALVLTVWEPFAVGFVPPSEAQFDAARAAEVKKAAEQTAAEGAALAETAGFRARSRAVQSAPTWKGIVEFADEHDAGIIVLGSHGRTGLAGRLLGSVAGAVAAHSRRSVLIVHRRS